MNISLSLSELCEAISVRESYLERSETAYLMKLITEASGVRAVGGHGGKEDLPRAIEDEDATSRAYR